MLNLKKPLAIIDLETTGIQIANDRIIEIAIVRIDTEQNKETLEYRVNPGRPIPPESSMIHGIYDDDIKDAPLFEDIAEEVVSFINGCDMGGFNSNRFDIPLLIEELMRAGIALDTKDIRFIDVQRIFHLMEKRTLEAAYEFYCKKKLDDAHSASADALATYEVLCAQLQKYKDHLKNDMDFLHDFSKDGDYADFGRRIIYRKGIPCFNFGKYKGRTIAEVLEKEPQYYDWIMKSDFLQHTKQKLKEIRLQLKFNNS